jgi:lysozyme-like protein
MAVEESMTRAAAARVLGACALVALIAAFIFVPRTHPATAVATKDTTSPTTADTAPTTTDVPTTTGGAGTTTIPLSTEAATTTTSVTFDFVPMPAGLASLLLFPDLSSLVTIPVDPEAAPTPEDIQLAIMTAWPPELRDTATIVADCESGLNPLAAHVNPNLSIDYGLFQLNDGINGVHSTLGGLGGTPELALDLNWNAQHAYTLFLQRGWEPWSCAKALGLLLTPPEPGRYPLPPFDDVPTTTTEPPTTTTTWPLDTDPPPPSTVPRTTTTIPVDTEPLPGQWSRG